MNMLKYANISANKRRKRRKTGAEQTLSGIATTILIIGIISTIICLSTIVFVDSITGLDFSVQGSL